MGHANEFLPRIKELRGYQLKRMQGQLASREERWQLRLSSTIAPAI